MLFSNTYQVAAYLYRHLGEQMPEPVTDGYGNIDIDADNAALERWSQSPELNPIAIEDVRAFTQAVDELLGQIYLTPLAEQNANNYMTLCYNAAKRAFGDDKQSIRQFFRWLYLVCFGYENGPRWGEFIEIYGQQNFIEMVERRFREL